MVGRQEIQLQVSLGFVHLEKLGGWSQVFIATPPPPPEGCVVCVQWESSVAPPGSQEEDAADGQVGQQHEEPDSWREGIQEGEVAGLPTLQHTHTYTHTLVNGLRLGLGDNIYFFKSQCFSISINLDSYQYIA